MRGLDKEQWRPALAKLFELCDESSTLQAVWRVREAWALDAPNHGDSAILNRAVLSGHKPLCV